jgi:hypothetical protein
VSILLLVGEPGLDEVIVARLRERGDEVRVISDGDRRIWTDLGAFVASGDAADPDLVERAAQNARTLVSTGEKVSAGLMEVVLPAAAAAGVDRFVACAPRIDSEVASVAERSGLNYVLLSTGRSVFRRGPTRERVAEAVDAADDLAGTPRLQIDLRQDRELGLLGLSE